jgi:hypothetical protein
MVTTGDAGQGAQAMTIRVFQASDEFGDMVEAFQRDGAFVVNELVPTGLMDEIAGELRPYFDSEGRRTENDFNGYSTLRISGILAKSKSSAALAGHKLVLKIADAILLPHCASYQFGSLTGIEILPGENPQRLHRDDGIYPIRMPGMEWQISTNWALDDFTIENGATHVVPRSHRRREPWPPAAEESVQTPMKKGSVLFYMGSLWHGGGANRSNRARKGLVNTYSLGWLRHEENHYLMVPREMAQDYPEPVRRLLGYQSHGGFLGWYSGHPDEV